MVITHVPYQNNGVFAVIVTYHSDVSLVPHLLDILQQVEKLVIVDNGSEDAVIIALRSMTQSHPTRLYLIENNENKGLAAAQNQGIKTALNEGAAWVLLLDDDSRLKPMMVTHLLKAAEHPFSDGSLPRFLAPNLIQPSMNGLPTRYVVPFLGPFCFRRISLLSDRNYLDDAIVVIASGSMLERSMLEQVGRMREAFFIDYVDTEYALRARKLGFRIRVVKDAELEHHIGQKQTHGVIGATVVTSNHSPRRRYTIFRNRVVMWREYLLTCPNYVIYDIMAAFYDLFRIAAFEKRPFIKLGQAFRGIGHGLIGRLGNPRSR